MAGLLGDGSIEFCETTAFVGATYLVVQDGEVIVVCVQASLPVDAIYADLPDLRPRWW